MYNNNIVAVPPTIETVCFLVPNHTALCARAYMCLWRQCVSRTAACALRDIIDFQTKRRRDHPRKSFQDFRRIVWPNPIQCRCNVCTSYVRVCALPYHSLGVRFNLTTCVRRHTELRSIYVNDFVPLEQLEQFILCVFSIVRFDVESKFFRNLIKSLSVSTAFTRSS